MKKTWIGLTLAAALCLSLAGCAGNKTGGEITPGSSAEPTAQVTTDPGTGTGTATGGDASNAETGTDAANGGNNSGEALEGNENTRMGTTRGTTGRADDSALERMGDGIKDTLDDMGTGARRMAQDAKQAME